MAIKPVFIPYLDLCLRKMVMNFGKLAIEAFNQLTPNLNKIYKDAAYKTLSNWRNTQVALVSGSGATAADVAFLMNRMSVCSFGIGAIHGYDNGQGNFLEEEDFANVLGYWSHDAQMMTAITSKGAADMAAKVGSKAAIKLISKHLATGAGLLIGKKLSGKLGAKVGAKFGVKLAAKIGTGFVPLLGPLVGGGINAYFINDIADAASDYYRWKCDVAHRLN